MIEVWIVPEGRRWRRRRAEKVSVLFVGDLGCGEKEGIDLYTMNGTLAILASIGAHEEVACRNSLNGGPGLDGELHPRLV